MPDTTRFDCPDLDCIYVFAFKAEIGLNAKDTTLENTTLANLDEGRINSQGPANTNEVVTADGHLGGLRGRKSVV